MGFLACSLLTQKIVGADYHSRLTPRRGKAGVLHQIAHARAAIHFGAVPATGPQVYKDFLTGEEFFSDAKKVEEVRGRGCSTRTCWEPLHSAVGQSWDATAACTSPRLS
jgi:hypothetical protein